MHLQAGIAARKAGAMTNVALSWPSMEGVDMTSPAEIEKAAEFVASEPTQERRHNALFDLGGKHSAHVYHLIKKRAKQIYKSRSRR